MKAKSKEEKLELIKFEKAEQRIDQVSFDEFFKNIYNNRELISDW